MPEFNKGKLTDLIFLNDNCKKDNYLKCSYIRLHGFSKVGSVIISMFKVAGQEDFEADKNGKIAEARMPGNKIMHKNFPGIKYLI